ncbi:hypothetical protein AB0942_34100 [Streptomyces nodosus]|uniref:hypothetical protein n=1 Tax=Streptomyces nodosus TaxID=40318 RepID=UPI0034541813
MSRQLVDGGTVRAWPYFAQARSAVAAAAEKIADLQPTLADFCGCDLRSLEKKAA